MATVPIPGKIPNQCEKRTKKKTVATIGKYLRARSSLPAIEERKPRRPLTTISTTTINLFGALVAPWVERARAPSGSETATGRGLGAKFLRTKKATTHRNATMIQAVNIVFVMGKPKIVKRVSAESEMCSGIPRLGYRAPLPKASLSVPLLHHPPLHTLVA